MKAMTFALLAAVMFAIFNFTLEKKFSQVGVLHNQTLLYSSFLLILFIRVITQKGGYITTVHVWQGLSWKMLLLGSVLGISIFMADWLLLIAYELRGSAFMISMSMVLTPVIIMVIDAILGNTPITIAKILSVLFAAGAIWLSQFSSS